MSQSQFGFSKETISDHPDIRRINNNLVYIAAVLSDILERIGLVAPSATHDQNIIHDNPICIVDECREDTFSVLVEPDEDPTPVCYEHFNEVMQSHLDQGKAGNIFVREDPSEDW